MAEGVRSEGTVKFWKQTYGFITPDGDGADVFVYWDAVVKEGYRSLSEGERVSFDLCEGPKGRYAEAVKPL